MWRRKNRETGANPTNNSTVPRTPMEVAERHRVLENPLMPPFPAGLEVAVVGMGCFWGAERLFWQLPGVYSTAVGYAGGSLDHPSYTEVCSGQTGHAEVVQIVFDPTQISYDQILAVFWEGHDPTQGDRQGNDIGSQYRSVILTTIDIQTEIAQRTAEAFEQELRAAGWGEITTEIAPLERFFYAEDYHQQYLDKNPGGYCGLGGTGVACPTVAATSPAH